MTTITANQLSLAELDGLIKGEISLTLAKAKTLVKEYLQNTINSREAELFQGVRWYKNTDPEVFELEDDDEDNDSKEIYLS